MGDINTNIRIDQLQTVVKAIAKRGSIRTKLTTFYPASSGDAFDFTPEEDAVVTVWSTASSSPNQMYGGVNVGPLQSDYNYALTGTNSKFGYSSGTLTCYFAAPGGLHLLEIMVDNDSN